MSTRRGGDVPARERKRLRGLTGRRRTLLPGERRELCRLGATAWQNQGVRLNRSKVREADT